MAVGSTSRRTEGRRDLNVCTIVVSDASSRKGRPHKTIRNMPFDERVQSRGFPGCPPRIPPDMHGRGRYAENQLEGRRKGNAETIPPRGLELTMRKDHVQDKARGKLLVHGVSRAMTIHTKEIKREAFANGPSLGKCFGGRITHTQHIQERLGEKEGKS
ncbi:hypothetical protein LIER_33689 [Lithospermum erythrorhizon]|uniref:Uncharacterized protein n=1 Tax=Lithospermum erythrorhizon TaxID=34254 RepID=A0AAV3S312_LITER